MALRSLHSQAGRLADRHGVAVTVVGLANARDGFVYKADGLDIASVLELIADGRSIADQPGVRHFSSALDGLAGTDADVLVEVTASPAGDGEPGLSHMREALGRGIPVVTSNKWPVALHGVELARRADPARRAARILRTGRRRGRQRSRGALRGGDPLANVGGTTNAVICRARPVGEITIVGPGAGLELAGQGVLSDLIAVARLDSPSEVWSND